MKAALDVSMETREGREGVARAFFESTGATYDRVVALSTLGLDRLWKRALLAAVPRGAGRVLDLACGTGIVLRGLLRRCPQARLVGVDLTESYLAVARRRFARHGGRVTLVLGNAEDVRLEGLFDAVVSSYLPKYVDATRLLSRLEGHLAPGAVLALHDFTRPGALAHVVWRAWMRVLAHVGPVLGPGWEACLDGDLERLVEQSAWHRDFLRALHRAGFTERSFRSLTFGAAGLLTARWTGEPAARPGPLRVRSDLLPGDLDTIVSRHGALYAREHGFDASFASYVRAPLEEVVRRASPRERVWIAERGGRFAGSAAITTADERTAQIRWVLVEPAERGHGLGTRLLRQALAFAREAGYDRVTLWTVDALEAAARRYRALGFRLAEERPGRRWGADVVEQRYELRLGN
jgi:ubiquinone/menaquinone biosynthesis C-methylase UbiE/GNAT superfamily N-acetyltransferase